MENSPKTVGELILDWQLPPNDKIRNRLVAKPIVQQMKMQRFVLPLTPTCPSGFFWPVWKLGGGCR